MPKIKAFIFDLGGVVINPGVEQIKRVMSRHTGIDYAEYEKFNKSFSEKLTKGELTLRDFYSSLLTQFNINNTTDKELTKKHMLIFVEILRELNINILKLINDLRKDYKVVCMVNEELDVIPVLRKHGIYKNFDKSFISAKLGMQKPETKFYSYVLNKLKVKPNEAFFIDDKAENVSAARKIGLNTHRYKWGTDLGIFLRKKKLLN